MSTDTTAHFGSSPHTRETPKTILCLSQQTIKEAVDALAYQIKLMKPILLVGVARGGLIPCTMLSHKLNLPMEVISAQSYEGTRRTLQRPTEIQGWKDEYDNDRVVFIDDIIDTGDTFKAVKCLKRMPTYPRFVTLVNKIPSKIPTAHFINVDPDIWIKFPWEV